MTGQLKNNAQQAIWNVTGELQKLGNGDAQWGWDMLCAVATRLQEARKKHPRFAETPVDAAEVVGAETNELIHAVYFETAGRQQDEALDVIATAIRFYNREYESNGDGGKQD